VSRSPALHERDQASECFEIAGLEVLVADLNAQPFSQKGGEVEDAERVDRAAGQQRGRVVDRLDRSDLKKDKFRKCQVAWCGRLRALVKGRRRPIREDAAGDAFAAVGVDRKQQEFFA
jgi:hypothetical protein